MEISGRWVTSCSARLEKQMCIFQCSQRKKQLDTMNETSYYLYNSAIKADSQPWSYPNVRTVSMVHIFAQENVNIEQKWTESFIMQDRKG